MWWVSSGRPILASGLGLLLEVVEPGQLAPCESQSSLVEHRSDVQAPDGPPATAIQAQRAGEHVLQGGVERPALQGQAGLEPHRACRGRP